MSANLLADQTSPYLLQHKDNPVHWRAWGPETLTLAKREDKPILLSIGYAACHWCHVMAHESFEDESVARVMNDGFINVKVDREERPDLDAIYQTALALMGQHGGWPLTMFLTPAGEPFWGGTYFPPISSFGRPAFTDVLRSIADTYRREPDKVVKNVEAVRDAMTRLAKPRAAGLLSANLLEAPSMAAIRMVDPLNGGTDGAPKFPQPSFFKFLWRAYRRTSSPRFREAVTVTLDKMCQGGIYDHLGGGFARYATDAAWLVPHFEKMLYDNALLIELLTEVWQETRSPLYAHRVRETVQWVLREMRVWDGPPEGDRFAFASAFDADSEGEEGAYYVWSTEEIDTLLADEAPAFKAAYDVTTSGNWEGRTILNRSRVPGLGGDADEARLARCREKMLAARAGRVPPLRDDKVLADWNGLMIAALAGAGAAFDERPWVAAAEAGFAFVRSTMVEDGRLRHAWRAGRARHAAVLDDYANLVRAALILFEVTGHDDYLRQAQAWVKDADRHHWDAKDGGYFLSADDTTDVITRTKTVFDNAVPAGNGTMVEVLARLFHLTGRDAYRTRAVELVRAFTGGSAEQLVAGPTLLVGYELLERAVQVVVIGEADEAATEALVRSALESPVGTRILLRLPPGTGLSAGHPAHGKDKVDGAPTAYVCVGPTCGLPITDAAALKERLSGL